jgi:hypothetical protein
MEMSFSRSSDKPGCSFSFSIGSLPVFIGIGALAKYLGWIDWSWLTIILVSVGISIGLLLLLLIPVIIMMVANAKFASGFAKENKAERKAYQEQLKREAKEAEVAKKAREEYEKQKAMESKQNSAGPYAQSSKKFNALSPNDPCYVVNGLRNIANKEEIAAYTHSNGNWYIVVSKDKEAIERFANAKADNFKGFTNLYVVRERFDSAIRETWGQAYAGILYIDGNKASVIKKDELN